MSNKDKNNLDVPDKKQAPFIEVASNIHSSPMKFNMYSAHIYGSKNKSGSICILEDDVSMHGLLSASKATNRVITRIL